MNRPSMHAVPLLLLLVAVLSALPGRVQAEAASQGGDALPSWPSFRGAEARGLAATEQSLPVTWQVEKGENLRWRTEIPGLGHSSPIVWGDRIYVTTAVAETIADLTYGDDGGIDMATDELEHTWMLLAYDAATGGEVWRREVVTAAPKAKRHVKASQANSSPATDGEVIAAIFGSQGLFVFDLEGKLLWRADLGILDPGFFGNEESQWGYASSPIVVDDKVIVQVDRHADSFLAAYRAADGERLWKVERDERPVWSTPTYHDGHGRRELIVMGGYYVRSYDLDTGEEIWRFADDAQVKIPTALVVDDQVILSGGFRARPLFSVTAGGRGDLSAPADASSGEHLRWRTEPGGPYTTTPIAYRDRLYSVTDKGILNVYDLETGERLERVRADEHFSASPVAADGKIYFAGEGGEVLVVRAGDSLEILARNDMGEPCMATPAIAHDTLYVRTTKALYAIAETAPAKAADPEDGAAKGEAAKGEPVKDETVKDAETEASGSGEGPREE